MTNNDFAKLTTWMINTYGNGANMTITFDGSTYTGTIYGNDECFDGDEFYQYFLTPSALLKAYYTIPDDCTDFGDINYSAPYDVRPEDVQYWLDFVI